MDFKYGHGRAINRCTTSLCIIRSKLQYTLCDCDCGLVLKFNSSFVLGFKSNFLLHSIYLPCRLVRYSHTVEQYNANVIHVNLFELPLNCLY